MLIRDIEYKSSLDRATIRFYEKEGLITPSRQENGYRTYTQEDLDTLLKVKLLRQLGMSLEKIKSLQQGRDDFTTALNEQIEALEHQIREANQAKAVCLEIRKAGVDYQHLDAAYYLELLSRPLSQSQTPVIKPNFQEPITPEYHPVRRFAGRFIDYYLLNYFLRFLLVVVLRVRPFGDLLSVVVTYGSFFLMIPAEAAMLHFWGTTPGKWVMGIRIESCNGGNLSFQTALEREREVLRYGLGWGIPIWEIWRMYKSYKAYGSQPVMDWDTECEYVHNDPGAKRKVVFAGVICLIAVMIAVIVSDSIKPKYRGEDLTVAQFAENYNFYLTVLSENVDQSDKLQPDGTKYSRAATYVIVYVDAQPEKENASFEYEMENGCIRSISYHNTWSEIFYFDPFPGECLTAAISVMMAQNGIHLSDLTEFLTLWNAEKSESEGHIRYENVEVCWTVKANNCERSSDNRYFYTDKIEDSSLSLDFQIVIHNK